MQPSNSLVRPLLTDLYQLTMAYGYWKSHTQDAAAVFDLFFRENPFKGEFTVFAGLEEVLGFLSDFKITPRDIAYLRDGLIQTVEEQEADFEELQKAGVIQATPNGYQQRNPVGGWEPVSKPASPYQVQALLGSCEPAFFDWLQQLNCSKLRVYALPEGCLTFPKIPLLRVEGPVALVQLLETTLLNLINYASLVATNAARYRLAVGKEKTLLEFGLRRAQGPDGGLSASQYCYLGGFDATSNVLAGQKFGIPVRGTHAHSFVSAFTGFEDLPTTKIKAADSSERDIVQMVLAIRQELGLNNTNTSELAAFVAYAQAFPQSFLGLVDTYDTLHSGVPNFLCVAIALIQLGYTPIGIRLDSGDLAYLSCEARKLFVKVLQHYGFTNYKFVIVASNDINEETLYALREQGHEIDCFGIGTHLVTCQKQPALGCVYKLVEIHNRQRIKLSQEKSKMTIPGRKSAYRLIGKEGYPLLDLLMEANEASPQVGEKILCRHPFEASKRAYVIPNKVIPLHRCVWEGHRFYPVVPLEKRRAFVLEQLDFFRSDHLRFVNPTPYKISVTDHLYHFLHNLWQEETPIDEIS